LRTRQELGDEYGIGLSLNTKGIIHERLGNPVTAIQNSEQALALFREIGNVRGIMMAHINLGRAYRRMARSIEWEQKNVDFEKGRYYLEEAIRAQNPDSDKFYQVEALDELGCLYRDWAATLHEKGEQNDQIAAFLDVAEETLQNAAKLTSGQGDKGMPRVVQYVDLLEDLAHVHYWRERLATPCNEGNPLIVMEDVLDRAEAFARECLEGQGEIKLVLAKVFFQKARLARLKRQDVAEVASYYGLAAGYAESHSWDAPEARKTVADACDWLDELDDEEAKQAIRAAYDALARAGLHSRRLYDSIENVVKPLLGIDWQANEQEASDG
jgi:tetratricopeptide (TPR) repeat protein